MRGVLGRGEVDAANPLGTFPATLGGAFVCFDRIVLPCCARTFSRSGVYSLVAMCRLLHGVASLVAEQGL